MRIAVLMLLLGAGPSAAEEEPPADPDRLEVGGLPVVAYDSDHGLQLGVLVALARFDPAYAPYRWRLEVLLSATVKQRTDGSWALPFHDDYVKVDLPGLLEDRLRLGGEAHWGRYTDSAWYGPGDASTDRPPPGGGDRYFLYERTYPRLELGARWLLWKGAGPRARVELLGGASGIYNNLTIEPESSLARDVALAKGTGPDAETLRPFLHGVDQHLFVIVKGGLSLDTRDRELAPSRGFYGELSLRAAPGYAGLYAVATGFVPLWDDDLVLATRGVLDLMAGEPPFYALTEAGAIGPTTAIGGGSSVRGVPGQRYGGKIKAFVNLELRAQLVRFTVLGQRLRVGVVALLDAGRVWADFSPVVLGGRDVDGVGHLATGLGGGLRLQWGDTLLIRADLAASPSEGTEGLYIDLGHAF